MKRVAILGATGYIGRSLASQFLIEKTKVELHLFSRSKSSLQKVFKSIPEKALVSMHTLLDFKKGDYDVILNCTGIGDTRALKKDPSSIFRVTEEMDELILTYLSKKPKTLYINISSGAVYGNNTTEPITDRTESTIAMKGCTPYECYSIAKINSEVKHRAHSMFNVVDLRVFAFFSHCVDTASPFLMSEIASAIKDKKIFKTTKEDIMRDYSTPKDLLALIRCVWKKNTINDFFDVYSKKPVSKFEILQFLAKKYDLVYEIEELAKGTSRVSSSKKSYFSKSRKAEKLLGYAPELSSLEGIEVEISKMNL